VALTSELYRSLVDQSCDAIVLSRSGRIVSVNPAALRLLGAATVTSLGSALTLTNGTLLLASGGHECHRINEPSVNRFVRVAITQSRFGVKAAYVFGSTKNGTAGPSTSSTPKKYLPKRTSA
jgi:hypothetical protein